MSAAQIAQKREQWQREATTQAPGQVVERIEFHGESMRIQFASGASLLHGPDGATHWRATVVA